jgi:hypothetical protein
MAVLWTMGSLLLSAGVVWASGVESEISDITSYTLNQAPCVKLMTARSGEDIGCSSTCSFIQALACVSFLWAGWVRRWYEGVAPFCSAVPG